MVNPSSYVRVGLCCLVLSTAGSVAGPLEDARKLIAEGKFGEVDAALSEPLAQTPPPAEALKISMEAAMADGRFVSAGRRCQALLDGMDRKDPEVIFTAAHLSNLAGDTTREAEMWVLFMRLQTEPSEKQRRALLRLIAIGTEGSAFTRYAGQYEVDESILKQGTAMLTRLAENGEAGGFVELADELLSRSSEDPGLSGAVAEILQRAASNGLFMNTPGLPLDGSGKQPAKPSDGYRHDLCSGEPDHSVLRGMVDSKIWADPKSVPADAATRILGWKDRYAGSSNRSVHRDYVQWVLGNTALFDQVLDQPGRLALAGPLKKRFADAPAELHGVTRALLFACKDEGEMKSVVSRFGGFVLSWNLYEVVKGRFGQQSAKQRLAIFRKLAGKDSRALFDAIELIEEAQDDALLVKVVREAFLARPGNLDANRLNKFVQCDRLTPAARTAVLAEAYQKAGYSNVLRHAATTGRQHDSLKKSPEFQKFANSLNAKQVGSDPILTAHARIFSAGEARKKEAAGMHESVATALQAYGAPFPAGKPTDPAMREILDRYFQLCDKNKPAIKICVETTVDHLGPGGPWQVMSYRAAQVNDPALRLRAIEAAFRNGVPATQLHAGIFLGYELPESGSKYLLADHYASFAPNTCLSAIRSVTEGAKDWAAGLDEMAKLLKAHPEIDENTLREICTYSRQWGERVGKDRIPQDLLDELGSRVFAAGRDGSLVGYVMALHNLAGKLDPAIGMFRRNLENVKGAQLFNALGTDLFNNVDDARRVDLVVELAEVGASLDEFERSRATLPGEVVEFLYQQVRREQGSEAVRKKLTGLEEKFMDLVAAGMSLLVGNRQENIQPLVDAIDRHLAANNFEAALRLIRITLPVGGSASTELLTSLRNSGRWELLYLACDAVTEQDKKLFAFARQQRGMAAAKIPGIYPVGPEHPTFPIHVASSELARGNENAAWEQLRDNINIFAKDPLVFDSNFVVWATDKLRKVRGDDDALLSQARELCDRMLVQEENLDVDTVAALTLVRARIFRDLGNLEAAELEFKTLLSNPALQQTGPGRQARYSLVDLMISRGNLSGAEERIDTWLAFPDPALHTEAYYYKALMAFEGEDYELCREMLNQVFEREYGHEHSRLLEGEWRKATRNLDDPDIHAGARIEMTLLVPGQDLKLSIHDKNLAVIGEGSFIPVVVTTSVGKDSETVNLYPAVRTPNLFRSTVATALGDADPGNLQLEVNGGDIIRYEIDPVFMKDRGLETRSAKELRVVDDAWVSVSAGRILTEEEEKQQALREQVAAIRGQKLEGDRWESHRTVRPGNPLYVMVRDRDRDRSSGPDTIKVSLTTSSGDILPAAALTETSGHSGMFRGAIATATPLPRAYASDSAEGKDPAVLINSSKPGSWSSRPDGESGKWVEVDTMSSPMVKEFAIAMPNPSAVRGLSLYGSIHGESIRLGRFPADAKNGDGEAQQRGGLKLQVKSGALPHNQINLSRIRSTLRDSEGQAVHLDVPTLQLEEQADQIGYLSGIFHLAEGRNVPMAFLPGDPSVFYAYLLIDGSVLLGGRADQLLAENKVEEIYLAAGAHRLELYLYNHRQRGNAGIGIGWQPQPGQTEPLPAQWFSVSDNPGLAEFLQDKAVIEQAEEGFVASFESPIRVRKLRWQFDDYDGSSVTATGIILADDKGGKILPVTHDFTTGLTNDQLELAPGDMATVTYRDTRNTKDKTRVLTGDVGAGFSNAHVGFSYEIAGGIGEMSKFADAYRFQPGKTVMVTVFDPDADVTDQADSVEVTVRSAAGGELKLTAIEVPDMKDKFNVDKAVHSASFRAIVKTSTDTPGDADTIQVTPTDRLVASYQDEENTDPGVPATRESEPLAAVKDTRSQITVLRGLREMVPGREPGSTVEKVHYETVPEEECKGKTVVVDASIPLRFDVSNPGRALHADSKIMATLTTASDAEAAKAEGREARQWKVELPVNGGTESQPNSIFAGDIQLRMGPASLLIDEPVEKLREGEDPDLLRGPLEVQGADTITVAILDPDGNPELLQTFKLATAAIVGLFDKNYEEEDAEVHMGEKFYLQVTDADQDLTTGHDAITVSVKTPANPAGTEFELTETLPHSGLFSAAIRTEFIGAAGGETPAPEGDLAAGLRIDYGQEVGFTYVETTTIPGKEPGPLSVTGKVLLGADGAVAMFSKRYADRETAARVQFRTAECLFEMAKEYRKVDNTERASDAIARGKLILEEAMEDYPNTSLVTEGLYLLANLHQELAAEEMDKKNEKEAIKLYQQAISRFANIIATWPDSAYAARAQFHKAMCLEKLGDDKRASEEYVRLCYAYPDSPLVADATVRLATHFYNQARYDVAGRIYENFARHYPGHEKAPKVMFMAAQSHMKQGEVWAELLENPDLEKADIRFGGRKTGDLQKAISDEYLAGAKGLDHLVNGMKDQAGVNLRSQAMYWSGMAYYKAGDMESAYLRLKQVTFEYPDSKWARMARGLMLQDEALERMGNVK